jgi:hypothetical protein
MPTVSSFHIEDPNTLLLSRFIGAVWTVTKPLRIKLLWVIIVGGTVCVLSNPLLLPQDFVFSTLTC